MHQPITRDSISARRARRMPAGSRPAPSARSLAGIRIILVSRPHGPRIIAPWQGIVPHSGFTRSLRHHGDRTSP